MSKLDLATVEGLRCHLVKNRLIEPSQCSVCKGKNPLIEFLITESGPDSVELKVYCVFCEFYPRTCTVLLEPLATLVQYFGVDMMPELMVGAVRFTMGIPEPT